MVKLLPMPTFLGASLIALLAGTTAIATPEPSHNMPDGVSHKEVIVDGDIWRLGSMPTRPSIASPDGDGPLSARRAVLYRIGPDGVVYAIIDLQPEDQTTGRAVRIAATERAVWVDISLNEGAQRLRIDPNTNAITNRTDIPVARLWAS